MTPGLFPMLARFNAWANERIYDCCAKLSDTEYRQDRRAFFGSIHATLNHLLVVDKVWRARIEGVSTDVRNLDQILHNDLPALRAARVTEDESLIRTVDRLAPKDGARVVKYRFMNGTSGETPVDIVLITLFNHQTHHRGQVPTLLTQAGITPPPLDIIAFPGAQR
jgi:uncharacterized damage-inducible protein DinB